MSYPQLIRSACDALARSVATTLTFAIALVTLPSCQSIRDFNLLRVGMSADFAPFCFIEEGIIKGFDVDLVSELAARLEMKVEFQDLPFETLIPELAMGKLQMVAGGMSPSPQRAKSVLFSTSYLQGDPIVAAMAGNSPWLLNSQWEGAKIAVCLGYTSSDDYVVQTLKLEPMRLNNLMECVLALQSGQVDIIVGPSLCLQPLLQKEAGRWLFLAFENSADVNALLLSKLEPHLKEKVDVALQAMIKERRIEILKAKWGLV